MKLISKDTVVAWIRNRLLPTVNSHADEFERGENNERISILNFINTLEVKEIDLDTEIRKYMTEHFNVYEDGVLESKKSETPLSTYDILVAAKHFFGLGLSLNNRIGFQNIDTLLEDEGINPDSKEGKAFKDSFYMALEKYKTQKEEGMVDFFSIHDKDKVAEVDKRIEEQQKRHDAKMRDAMIKAKDFPMSD